MEYVEVARARVRARASWCCGERRRRGRADGAGAAGQRRLRDGHPWRPPPSGRWPPRRWRWCDGPAQRARRRARARVHPARGARRLAGRARARSSRSSPRWSTGCATAPIPHGPALLADERVQRRRGRRAPGARPRPATRRTTWCCSTSTTGPGYLVHDANAALYEAPFLAPAATGAAARWRCCVVWSADQAPGLLDEPARGVRRRRASRRTRSTCRGATSTTGSTLARVASDSVSDAAPSTRIEHDSMGEVAGPARRPVAGADPAGGRELPDQRHPPRARD